MFFALGSLVAPQARFSSSSHWVGLSLTVADFYASYDRTSLFTFITLHAILSPRVFSLDVLLVSWLRAIQAQLGEAFTHQHIGFDPACSVAIAHDTSLAVCPDRGAAPFDVASPRTSSSAHPHAAWKARTCWEQPTHLSHRWSSWPSLRHPSPYPTVRGYRNPATSSGAEGPQSLPC